MSYTITDVVVPYTGAVPDGNVIDKTITVCGVVTENINRFRIVLEIHSPSMRIPARAYNLAVRMAEEIILFNTHDGEERWGKEIKIKSTPVKVGQPFEIVVRCEPDHFKTTINGKNFPDFPHRFPLEAITHLKIDLGPVTIHKITYSNLFDIDPRGLAQ